MTIEQAIKILKADETDDSFDWSELGLKGTEDFNRAWDEAYDMAIKALEESRNITNEELHQDYIRLANENERLYYKNQVLQERLPRWIPVSEKFPEEIDSYLITTKVEMYNLKPYYETNIARFDGTDFDIGYVGNGISVIAWCKIPEPYKEENITEQSLAYADKDTLMPAT